MQVTIGLVDAVIILVLRSGSVPVQVLVVAVVVLEVRHVTPVVRQCQGPTGSGLGEDHVQDGHGAVGPLVGVLVEVETRARGCRGWRRRWWCRRWGWCCSKSMVLAIIDIDRIHDQSLTSHSTCHIM